MIRVATIIIATLAFAYASWANSATTLYSKFAPQRGLQMDPTSAQALINITEIEAAKKDKSTYNRVVRHNAVTALRSEPLASRALRQLGAYYATIGNRAEGRKLIRLAATLSHRDSAGQLWLAEDYLRGNQHEKALRAIDVVLRTEPDVREIVFRTLGASLADPEFNRVFVAYARNRPSWLGAFIEYNVATLPQPQLLSGALVQLQPLPKTILSDTSSGVLLTGLVNRAPINDARTFYLNLPHADPQALRSLTFRRPADSLLLPPIGWELMNDGNVQGFGNVDGDTVAIEGVAAPGRRGTVARKLLFLHPGSYRWIGNADLTGLGGGTAGVSILCNRGPGDWAPIARKDLIRGRNSFDFAIASTCQAQLISIDVTGADSQSDASMEVAQMRLAPLSDTAPATNRYKAAAAPEQPYR